MSPDPTVVLEIAAELAIDPAFVEKDWYSVQVLKQVAQYQGNTIQTLFAGGTSLSKGHRLLQRFSEDLDFRCRYTNSDGSGNQQKKWRSEYRAGIVECIGAIDLIQFEGTPDIGSNFVKFLLKYPQAEKIHSSLRPNLQIEFSFTQPQLAPQRQPIQSLISEFTGGSAETEIYCLSPIETGADKLSALTWRVLRRNRNDPKDDPAMIRHLHDLCALGAIIHQEKDLFVSTARTSFDIDQVSQKRDTKGEFHQSLLAALTALQKDSLYQDEYRQYVDAMSYASDDMTIDFDRAITHFESIINLFI